MGADSSTLKSIDSLSSTLTDIEKRLTQIEDVQIHHERTIALDNSMIISGKRILCNHDASIVTGPIIGKLTINSARILLEVSKQLVIN